MTEQGPPGCQGKTGINSTIYYRDDASLKRDPRSVHFSRGKPYTTQFREKLSLNCKRRPNIVVTQNNHFCIHVSHGGGACACQSLLHPSTESTHLTCSSNLVITAWTHSTGLWAAMAGRRDTATLCWQIQGVRPELTSLSMHEYVSQHDGKWRRGWVFFPFL